MKRTPQENLARQLDTLPTAQAPADGGTKAAHPGPRMPKGGPG